MFFRDRFVKRGGLTFGTLLAVASACGNSDKPGGGPGPLAGSAGSAGSSATAGNAGAAGSAGTAGDGSVSGGSAGSAGSAGSSPSGGSAGNAASGEGGGAGDRGEAGQSAEGGEAGGGATTGEGGAGGSAGSGEGGEGGTDEPVARTTKLDLLFVVDNSISMFEKQGFLSTSVPALVGRLINPYCVDGDDLRPPGDDGECDAGQEREFEPVGDMHVGVITTSLGSRGSNDVCEPSPDRPENDDHGRLLPSVRENLDSWNGSGFLNWNPAGGGSSDAAALTNDLRTMIVAAGTTGCGYEAPLESFYRFLVDPEPPLVTSNDGAFTTVSSDPSNIDTELLAQRAAFLRPDSALVVIVLSDENDCSIVAEPGRQGWLVGYDGGPTASNWRMPRASAACASDPNDECCAPCVALPSSCPADPTCASASLTVEEDSMNLRCFEQRQRFGIDLLYPIDRYSDALSAPTVPKRSGGTAENPLFAGGRDPRQIVFTNIVGVPWQDLAVDPDAPDELELMTAAELRSRNRWPVIVGDYEAYEPPGDPFMIESIEPRSGENPVTGQPIVASDSTDPTATINGHEQIASTARDDLQYACIFPLPSPILCTVDNATGCDCNPEELGFNKPLCQEPGANVTGETQYFGKAYPGLRQLELARRLADRSVVASICPRNVTDVTRSDYGYLPAMRAIQARVSELLVEP